MKKIFVNMVFFAAVMLLGFSGCKTVRKTNKTQRGAAIGTAGGAVIGGVIGNNVGK